jgi:hypothetical protein
MRSRCLGVWLLGDFGQELIVVLKRLQSVYQQFETRSSVAALGQTAQHSAQFPNHLQLLAIKQQLFVSRA